VGVLLDELEKLLVTGQRLLIGGPLLPRHVAVEVSAIFPTLEMIVGAVGTLTHDTQFPSFHVLDLGDLT
jgi:hypothetical protein